MVDGCIVVDCPAVGVVLGFCDRHCRAKTRRNGVRVSVAAYVAVDHGAGPYMVREVRSFAAGSTTKMGKVLAAARAAFPEPSARVVSIEVSGEIEVFDIADYRFRLGQVAPPPGDTTKVER